MDGLGIGVILSRRAGPAIGGLGSAHRPVRDGPPIWPDRSHPTHPIISSLGTPRRLAGASLGRADGSACPPADRLALRRQGPRGAHSPAYLDAVDPTADVDLVDDDGEVQPPDLGQRRQGPLQPGLGADRHWSTIAILRPDRRRDRPRRIAATRRGPSPGSSCAASSARRARPGAARPPRNRGGRDRGAGPPAWRPPHPGAGRIPGDHADEHRLDDGPGQLSPSRDRAASGRDRRDGPARRVAIRSPCSARRTSPGRLASAGSFVIGSSPPSPLSPAMPPESLRRHESHQRPVTRTEVGGHVAVDRIESVADGPTLRDRVPRSHLRSPGAALPHGTPARPDAPSVLATAAAAHRAKSPSAGP